MLRLLRFLLLILLLNPFLTDAAAPAFRIERLAASAVRANDVRTGKLDPLFVPASVDELSDPGSETWFRIRPVSNWRDASPPVLIVRQTRFQQLTVFPPDGSEPTTLSALQRDFPASQTRGVLIFPLGATLIAGQSIYLRAHQNGDRTRLKPIIELASRDAALRASLIHVRLAAGTFSALLALALCAVCTWLIYHEALFLLFAGLAACQGIYVSLVFYEGFALPGMNALLLLGSRAPNLFAAIGALLAIAFARRMTDTRNIAPRLDRLLSWNQTLCLALLAALPFFPSAWMTGLVAVGNLSVALGTVLIAIACLTGWRQGSRAAAFFLLAWTTMQGFTFARTACDIAGVQPGLLVYYGFPISMVLAGVLLALGLADRISEMRAALREAQKHASTDSLTGVLNRHSILERLDTARKAFRNEGIPVSVLFVDIDHFKKINDTHGHLAGDACLREISRRLLARLRHSDSVGRYGGEEFLIVLSEVGGDVAARIAEQIRATVCAQPLATAFGDIALSCSIGVASSGNDALSAEDLIARADAALYAAKDQGRNRIAVAPESSLLAPDPLPS